jgi:hypothetical protein
MHEAGHILEQRARESNPKLLDEWKVAIDKDAISISPYGDSVAHEDLAEFALVYALCLDAGKKELAELKKLSPHRYAIWESILTTAKAVPMAAAQNKDANKAVTEKTAAAASPGK